MAVDTMRVLADVNAGLVIAYPNLVDVPHTVDAAERDAYRAVAEDLLGRSWVMRPKPDHVPGGYPLILTTLGEHFLLRGTPDRYVSRTSIGHVDGRFDAQPVTA